MTNPNNAIGTNGAYGGRTSVNAFNDVLQAFTGRGILTGFAISPGTGMQVSIGGDGEIRDVAIAEDNVGNFTTINNITQAPISLDIAAAPSANSRVDAIVAYVTNPPQGSSTVVDNPSACGLIDVAGAVAASPSTPTESDIRSAISADGGSGSTAYFVVLGYITIATGTTDITADMISAAPSTNLNHVGDGVLTLDAAGTGAGSDVVFSANQSNNTTVTPVWGTSNIGSSSITYAKMAANSIATAEIQSKAVTTAKIADSAVTSDKIDFATLESESTAVTMMYGLVFNLRKTGNLVTFSCSGFPTTSMAASGTSSETLPSGWRPVENYFVAARNSTALPAMLFEIYTSGKMRWWCGNAIGTSEVTVGGAYFIN